jgi:hypothetical protein
MGRQDVTERDASEAKQAYLGMRDVPEGECLADGEWEGLLEGMWPDINALATRMLADEAVIPVREQENLAKLGPAKPDFWVKLDVLGRVIL